MENNKSKNIKLIDNAFTKIKKSIMLQNKGMGDA